MNKKWRKIASDSWVIFKIEMSELFSRPTEALMFFTQFVLFYVLAAIPLWFFGVASLKFLGALYFAAMLNTIGLSQFSNLVLKKLESGEYEAYMLTPTSILSLYLSNLYTIWMIIPIFLLGYIPGIIEAGIFSLNLPLLILALILTIISNAGISIILTGIHLAYRSIREVVGIAGILIYFFCMFGVIGLIHAHPWNYVILAIPWTNSTILMTQSFNLNLNNSPIAYNIVYLTLFTLVTLPISLKIYKKAEKRAKKHGFTHQRQ